MTREGGERAAGWPAGAFWTAWVWMGLTLFIFTPALDGREPNAQRAAVQSGLLAALLLRYAWSRWRRERGRVWAAYVAVMVLAVPLWLLAEWVSGF